MACFYTAKWPICQGAPRIARRGEHRVADGSPCAETIYKQFISLIESRLLVSTRRPDSIIVVNFNLAFEGEPAHGC